jgi:two-component system LytT family sensor kinase
VVLPLFQEGVPEHWIALSRGVLRPPLTVSELSFVTTIGSQIQVRMATLLADERRLERLKRESALREQVADAELRALRAQINPHFLFNSLNTIADLAVVAPEKAEEMTLRLATVFRYVLVNTDRQFSTVKEEINFARSYLDIEEARFGSRLAVRFEVDESVLQETIPTLLLQPLIENAIKHGISPRRAGGTVNIVARRIPRGIELVVADDGVGLDVVQDEVRRGTSVGLENVRNRLQSAYDGRAMFSLHPREGGGTEATIVIHTGTQEQS